MIAAARRVDDHAACRGDRLARRRDGEGLACERPWRSRSPGQRRKRASSTPQAPQQLLPHRGRQRAPRASTSTRRICCGWRSWARARVALFQCGRPGRVRADMLACEAEFVETPPQNCDRDYRRRRRPPRAMASASSRIQHGGDATLPCRGGPPDPWPAGFGIGRPLRDLMRPGPHRRRNGRAADPPPRERGCRSTNQLLEMNRHRRPSGRKCSVRSRLSGSAALSARATGKSPPVGWPPLFTRSASAVKGATMPYYVRSFLHCSSAADD